MRSVVIRYDPRGVIETPPAVEPSTPALRRTLKVYKNYAAPGLPRDHHNRDNMALILIGMPGLEKQFSHSPQFHSRAGFAHQYRPLGKDELLSAPERQKNPAI